MSTLFGIIVNEKEIEIALRYSIGNGKVGIKWKTSLAHILPKNTPVIPLTNTAQGVYTIEDLRDLDDEYEKYEFKEL